MILKPQFPSSLHQSAAEAVKDYFRSSSLVDTVLVVNSCARGQAVQQSDLDFAILTRPSLDTGEKAGLELSWHKYSENNSALLSYRSSGPFAHLHLDIIDGIYLPQDWEPGGPIHSFEIEIGNHICYAAPMDDSGPYFKELQRRWLPYYNEQLRSYRLVMAHTACQYELDRVELFAKRGMYFHAFDLLYKAFQLFLQTLFISNKMYPIAYNKWIREQVVTWLNQPELYLRLLPILAICKMETNEIMEKVTLLRELVAALPSI